MVAHDPLGTITDEIKKTNPEIDDFNCLLGPYIRQTEMETNGFKCTFHMPKAVRRAYNSDGSEAVAGLPPGNSRPAFKVDEYPACPTGWMHGSGKAGSYFVPVIPEHGMWLDLNGNKFQKYDVAAVISVQGINPVTGRKTDPIRMEQYKVNCPVHGTPFKQDRFCESCKHKWPGQNYLCSNNNGPFWLDGFMTEEGVVRQWFLTEEECKGVAAQLIKDQRVFAIGIAFYRSKEPRKAPDFTPRAINYNKSGGSLYCGGITNFNSPGVYGSDSVSDTAFSNTSLNGVSFTCAAGGSGGSFTSSAPIPAVDWEGIAKGGKCSDSGPPLETKTSGGVSRSAEPLKSRGHRERLSAPATRGTSSRGVASKALNREAVEIEKESKKIEIGAGAKIDQRVLDDTETLEYWNDEPSAFIYINYCDIETCKRIIESGKRVEAAEGFMEGLKVAN